MFGKVHAVTGRLALSNNFSLFPINKAKGVYLSNVLSIFSMIFPWSLTAGSTLRHWLVHSKALLRLTLEVCQCLVFLQGNFNPPPTTFF